MKYDEQRRENGQPKIWLNWRNKVQIFMNKTSFQCFQSIMELKEQRTQKPGLTREIFTDLCFYFRMSQLVLYHNDD